MKDYMNALWLLLAALPQLAVGQAHRNDAARTLHWRLYVSNLDTMMHFAQEVLGMHLLRFDRETENHYIGYGPEESQFALELSLLSHNTKVASSQRGPESVQRFVIRLPDAAAARARAKNLGYAVEGHDPIITGPDGYLFQLLGHEASDGRVEPFELIVMRCTNPTAHAEWYSKFLGMTVVAHHGTAATVTLDAKTGLLFLFERTPGLSVEKIKPEPREIPHSSHTLAMPPGQIRAINERLIREDESSNNGGHGSFVDGIGMQLLGHLGLIFGVTLRDPEGHEVRIISSSAFNEAVGKTHHYAKEEL